MVIINNSELKLDDLITKAYRVVLVISTAWCGPCKSMTPILEELSNELPDVQMFKIDVTENVPSFVIDMKIRMVPTLLVYKNGVLVYNVSGAKTKEELQTIINS